VNSTFTPGNDRLMMAVLIASAVHVMAIFGITFDAFRAQNVRHQVEVTLVQNPGQRPTRAEHIAQTDQLGSGSEALRERASGEQSVLPQDAGGSAAMRAQARGGSEQAAAPVLTTTQSSRKATDRRGEHPDIEALPEADRELARLDQRLAQLQAELNAQEQQLTRGSRVRRLDAVSAKAAVDAAYLADWRQRVEAVGNQYYPQASLRYGIYGSLTMLVVIRANGALEDIRILESSGYAVLDEAAIRIVRMAAPYSPFPEELRATTDKLEILRTWQFEQNALSSTQPLN
jgi:protein TonB